MAQKETKSRYGPIHGIGTLVREGEIQMVHIDRRVFMKTFDEQDKIKTLRLNHKRAIMCLGGNPKKDINMKGIPL